MSHERGRFGIGPESVGTIAGVVSLGEPLLLLLLVLPLLPLLLLDLSQFLWVVFLDPATRGLFRSCPISMNLRGQHLDLALPPPSRGTTVNPNAEHGDSYMYSPP